MTDNIDKLLINTLINLNDSINESNKIYQELNNSIKILNNSIESMKIPKSKKVKSDEAQKNTFNNSSNNNNNTISNKQVEKLKYISNYENKYENINNFLQKWIYIRRKLFRYKLKNFINNFRNLKFNCNYGFKINNTIYKLLDNLITYDNDIGPVFHNDPMQDRDMPGKLLMTHVIKFLTNCREGDVILDHADIQESIVNSDTIIEIESQLSKDIPEEYNQKLEILQIIKDYYKLSEPELKPIIIKVKKNKPKKKIDKIFSESKDIDLNQGLLKVGGESEMSINDNTSSRNNSVIELGDITSDSYTISNISLIDETEGGNESCHRVHSQYSEFSEINNSHGGGTMENSSNGFNQGTVSSFSLKSKSDINIVNGSIEEQHKASNKLRHKTSGLLNLTIQLFESSNKNKGKNKNENKNNSKITSVRSHSNVNNFQGFDESFEEAANVSETAR
ncbi:unnamed protein product [[Candida] boidinii]|nr:unnamed protein product [[Candida] boidinii]